MPHGFRVVLLASVAFAAVSCSAQVSPVLSGFVTEPGSTTYRVNGAPVACNPAKTTDRIQNSKPMVSTVGCPQRVLGDSVSVYGVLSTAWRASETKQP